jgi:hypothetical protein
LDWSTSTDGVAFISDTAISGIKVPASAQTIADAICSNYKTYQSWDMINGTFGIASSGKVKVRDDSFGLNTANFKTAMDGVLVVYSFATPSGPIQLTAPQVQLLLGTNNVFADTGDIQSMLYATAGQYKKEESDERYAGIINESITTPADVVSFSDGADDLPMALKVAVEPVQDLHGQSRPYPAGGGKNLLPLTVASVKSFNTSGAWDGDEYTATTGVKFKIVSHDGISVDEIIANGTASSDTAFNLLNQANALQIDGTQTYFVSGCPSGGSSTKYRICIYSKTEGSTTNRVTNDYGAGNTLYTGAVMFWGVITVYSGQTVSNLSFRPMVEVGSAATTYAPYSNICPISGWTGANVTRTGETLSGSDLTVLNGYINTTGTYQTSSAGSKSVMAFVKSGSVKITKRGSSTFRIGLFSAIPTHSTASTSFVDLGSSVTEYTINVPTNCYLVSFVVNSSSSGDISASTQIIDSVKYYTRINTYTYTFPSSAGTVYGGELTVNKDGTGELVVDKKQITLSSTSVTWGSYNGMLHCDLTDRKKGANIWMPKSNVMKVQNPNTDSGSSSALKWYPFCISFFRSSTRLYLYLNSSISAAADIKAWLDENLPTLCYELESPVTYNLTVPQVRSLLGINNIWADTGEINEVQYFADTKLYADTTQERINNTQKIVAEAEATVATANHENGDLFICNNQLYRAIDSIAVGETLVIGENIVSTTIADEIAEIKNMLSNILSGN